MKILLALFLFAYSFPDFAAEYRVFCTSENYKDGTEYSYDGNRPTERTDEAAQERVEVLEDFSEDRRCWYEKKEGK